MTIEDARKRIGELRSMFYPLKTLPLPNEFKKICSYSGCSEIATTSAYWYPGPHCYQHFLSETKLWNHNLETEIKDLEKTIEDTKKQEPIVQALEEHIRTATEYDVLGINDIKLLEVLPKNIKIHQLAYGNYYLEIEKATIWLNGVESINSYCDGGD